MSETAKQALEELVTVVADNDLAKAFLKGYKSGIETAGMKSPEEKGKEEN